MHNIYPIVRPATDIVYMEYGINIVINMPGVKQKDLQLLLEKNILHIKASSCCPIPSGEKAVQALEFGNVEFSINISIKGYSSEPISTKLDKGILYIFIPYNSKTSKFQFLLY